MRNNYDKIARYYDMLSRLVFLRSQVKAQTGQLQHIPANSRILIAGGGTGWILEEITKIHPKGLSITYVEISLNMLSLSRKRDTGGNTVSFVHASIEEFSPDGSYDVILTAFLFDNFSASGIEIVFNQLDNALVENGLWLFSDFQYEEGKGKKWQLFLLKTMYLFFRNIAQIEARSLLQTAHYFKAAGYRSIVESYYYGRFIKSTVYCKMVNSAEHVHVPASAQEQTALRLNP